ncbi:MAG: hypothetical protein OES24_15640 [Acidimicrobiia bacterium]|nr:hypothetical protein [Acidimicrobiia bacterium]
MGTPDGFDRRLRTALGAMGDEAVARADVGIARPDRDPRRPRSSGLRVAAIFTVVLAVISAGVLYGVSTSGRPDDVEIAARESVGESDDDQPSPDGSSADGSNGRAVGSQDTDEEEMGDPDDEGASDIVIIATDGVTLPVLADEPGVDPARGQPLPPVLASSVDPGAAVIALESPDCVDACSTELMRLLVALDGVPRYLMKLGTEGKADVLTSASGRLHDAQLVFVLADDTILGREWYDGDGSTNLGRSLWYRDVVGTIGRSSATSMPIAEPADRVLTVDGEGSLAYLSTLDGESSPVGVVDERFDAAWTIDPSVSVAISVCCEPADGRIVITPMGSPPNLDAAAFNAASLDVSSDGRWIVTRQPSVTIWHASAPFEQSTIEALPPRSLHRAVVWAPGAATVIGLVVGDGTPPFAEIVSIDLEAGNIIEYSVVPMPEGTIDVDAVAVQNGGIKLWALVVRGDFVGVEVVTPGRDHVEPAVTLTGRPRSLAVDASGTRAVILAEDGSASVYDVETATLLVGPVGTGLRSAEW